jgi:lysophospholipase L1-like esterase
MNKFKRKEYVFWIGLFMVNLIFIFGLSALYLKHKNRISIDEKVISQLSEYERGVVSLASTNNFLKHLTDREIMDYATNWKNVIITVPIPFVDANFMTNVRGKYVNTNDLGYRGLSNFRQQIEIAKKVKESGGKILVLLGGSAAFGLYSDDDHSDIVGYVNSIALANKQNLIAFNFGMGSYISSQELATLVFYASYLEPDFVVVFDGYNDLQKISSSNNKYHLGTGVTVVYNNNRPNYTFSSEYLDEKIDIENLTNDFLQEFINWYKRNLIQISAFAKNIGSEVIFISQPIMGLSSVQICNSNVAFAKYIKLYPLLTKASQEVAVLEKRPYLNSQELFIDKDCNQGYFADEVHLTSKGQKIIAEKITEIISSKSSSGK